MLLEWKITINLRLCKTPSKKIIIRKTILKSISWLNQTKTFSSNNTAQRYPLPLLSTKSPARDFPRTDILLANANSEKFPLYRAFFPPSTVSFILSALPDTQFEGKLALCSTPGAKTNQFNSLLRIISVCLCQKSAGGGGGRVYLGRENLGQTQRDGVRARWAFLGALCLAVGLGKSFSAILSGSFVSLWRKWNWLWSSSSQVWPRFEWNEFINSFKEKLDFKKNTT